MVPLEDLQECVKNLSQLYISIRSAIDHHCTVTRKWSTNASGRSIWRDQDDDTQENYTYFKLLASDEYWLTVAAKEDGTIHNWWMNRRIFPSHYYALYGRVIELFSLLVISNQTLFILDCAASPASLQLCDPDMGEWILSTPKFAFVSDHLILPKVHSPRRRSEWRGPQKEYRVEWMEV